MLLYYQVSNGPLYRSSTVSPTIEDVMFTASVYVYGRYTAVICHMLISVLPRFHLLLFDRFAYYYSFYYLKYALPVLLLLN